MAQRSLHNTDTGEKSDKNGFFFLKKIIKVKDKKSVEGKNRLIGKELVTRRLVAKVV